MKGRKEIIKGINFSLGGFVRGVTIKNQKLKISPGLGSGKKTPTQKHTPEDFSPNISNLEEFTRKIIFSEISKINPENSKTSPTKIKEKTLDNQTTSPNPISGIMESISTTDQEIGGNTRLSEKNSETPGKKSKRIGKNSDNKEVDAGLTLN